MRPFSILLFLIFWGNAASAAEGIFVVGIGTLSCANWQSSPAKVKEGKAWLFGAWTGLNSINPKNRLVGSKSDARGLAAEVKRLCTDKPSMSLHEATLLAYRGMVEGG